MEVKVQAPVNIALIKYWGKRNEELILPLNDSISLNINELAATTTIEISSKLSEDSVTLNGERVQLKDGSRFQRVFKEARLLSCNKEVGEDDWHVRVDSETNFPVAAGLASSAAGFAAIACGIGRALHFDEADIVRLARIGSGSACRSVNGGFVHWRAVGKDDATEDGGITTIASAEHWPQLRAVVLVLDDAQKKIGSSAGMRATVATSALLKLRVNNIVSKHVEELKTAISQKDFECLARITMAESNQLHAVCLDTSPPLNYLNADSHRLIEFVHAFNSYHGAIILAYTFDAGPNCCLLLEANTLPTLMESLQRSFRFDKTKISNFLTQDGSDTINEKKMVEANKSHSNADHNHFSWTPIQELNVRSVICSKVGMGPNILSLRDVSNLTQKMDMNELAMPGTQLSCMPL